MRTVFTGFFDHLYFVLAANSEEDNRKMRTLVDSLYVYCDLVNDASAVHTTILYNQ
jgi:hypothetical protein